MFSFFNAPISNTIPCCCVTIKQVYEYIISDHAKQNTDVLRSLVDGGVRRAYKARNFDYVTFSGLFKVRKNDGLISHSGFMCFDIDHLPSEERLQEVKQILVNNELLHTVLLFRSPSGNGLKWVIEVPDRHWITQSTDNGAHSSPLTPPSSLLIDIISFNHRSLYELIREHLLVEYDIVCDATSDVTRPCYLCHDDEAYYDEPTFKDNPAHKFLTASEPTDKCSDTACCARNEQTNGLEPNSEKCEYVRRPSSVDRRLNDWDMMDQLIHRIEMRGIDITGNYSDWVRLGFAFANSFGESGRGFYHRVSQFHPRYNCNETNHQYDNCLKTNRDSSTSAPLSTHFARSTLLIETQYILSLHYSLLTTN